MIESGVGVIDGFNFIGSAVRELNEHCKENRRKPDIASSPRPRNGRLRKRAKRQGKKHYYYVAFIHPNAALDLRRA